MYTPHESWLPNYYELDELPFLKEDTLILEQSLTAKRMQAVRNTTHQYHHLLAKIFVYWPLVDNIANQEEQKSYRLRMMT
jgi:hypothetical protein